MTIFWFQKAERLGATHMVVVCDTFDYEDYPVFCMTPEEATQRIQSPGKMQRVREVYDISLGWEKQEHGMTWNPPSEDS